MLRAVPYDSATTLALGGNGWSLNDYLTASLWTATQGTPHPAIPQSEESKIADLAREDRMKEVQARIEERKARGLQPDDLE